VLKGASFVFDEGDRYLLLGPNGSGKTTLMKAMAGLLRPSSGRIIYRGKDIRDLGTAYMRRMAFATHENHLYEELTGLQNLEFFASLYGISSPRKMAHELLDRFGLLAFRNVKVRHYSQGMKQRLSMARTLIHGPEVLLLDECFSGVDSRGREDMREAISDLLRDGRGLLILTSHRPEEDRSLAGQAILLEDGGLESCDSMTGPSRQRGLDPQASPMEGPP
jgi:ABC-2 type transport system ATP-binding protein